MDQRSTDGAEKLTPEDFRLRPDSADYRAGKDGKDLGAEVDLVGPGAAYERWKKPRIPTVAQGDRTEQVAKDGFQSVLKANQGGRGSLPPSKPPTGTAPVHGLRAEWAAVILPQTAPAKEMAM